MIRHATIPYFYVAPLTAAEKRSETTRYRRDVANIGMRIRLTFETTERAVPCDRVIDSLAAQLIQNPGAQMVNPFTCPGPHALAVNMALGVYRTAQYEIANPELLAARKLQAARERADFAAAVERVKADMPAYHRPERAGSISYLAH